MTDIDNETGEVFSESNIATANALGEIVRAEIDMQIATAKRYPRDLKKVANQIMSLATLNEETAALCVYKVPRSDQPLRGASIRFAEALLQAWGHARAGALVTSINREDKIVTAEGFFHDLENNIAWRKSSQRSIRSKNGRIYSDDMIVVTGNAACSIAARNAILAGIPRLVWGRAYEAAEQILAGGVSTLAETRGKAVGAFAIWGVSPDEVFKAINVKSMDEITRDHIIDLRSMFAQIKARDATVEEYFRPASATHHEVVKDPLKPATVETMREPEQKREPELKIVEEHRRDPDPEPMKAVEDPLDAYPEREPGDDTDLIAAEDAELNELEEARLRYEDAHRRTVEAKRGSDADRVADPAERAPAPAVARQDSPPVAANSPFADLDGWKAKGRAAYALEMGRRAYPPELRAAQPGADRALVAYLSGFDEAKAADRKQR